MNESAAERRVMALFGQLIDVPESERAAWFDVHVGTDAALRARLVALLAADRADRLRTGGVWEDFAQDEAPERVGAYQITGLIGQGGMGAVYRGERDAGDFSHAVAIKVVKRGLLSEALAERFRHERQTLARLSHPNIARLFDGGETADGSPYIVMELIDGLPLPDWVAASAPSPDARRALFVTICRAVAFAHANLVVHRDITPSNVLVTTDGAPRLIDFGIARAPEEGDGREGASIGSLSLTPGYAAPERMAGAAVATATDIYSLGKLLDWLVPGENGLGDAERAAIIARATAPDPAARYPTAEALAEDVSRWGAGLPVAAMDGGKRYATRKFLARHRLGAALAGVAILGLVGALIAVILANQRERAARTVAEQRFAQTRAIARTMLFDVFDDVSKVSGSTQARQRLASTGLDYLEALAGDAHGAGARQSDIAREAGLGFLRLGQVVGGGQAGQLGRYDDANALLARAGAILKPLYERDPGDSATRLAYGQYLVEQAGVDLYTNNAADRARAAAETAEAVLVPLSRGSVQAAREYALAIQAQGDSFGWNDDYARALGHHERAERFIAALPPAMREAVPVRMVRSGNLRLLGEAQHRLKRAPEAKATLAQAVAINRALLAPAPDDPALARKLVTSLWYSAVVHRTNRRDVEAERAIEEASALAARLSARDPKDAGALHLVAITEEVQAQVLADLGRFPESYAAGDAVLAAHRQLVALGGSAPGALRSMAAAMRTIGGNHYNGGDYAGACGHWRATLAIYRDLEARGSLTAADRKGGMAEMTDFIARACDNGGPRKGLDTLAS